jgi:serine phosphatase RsbU (regulator of sigma subunit)
VSPVSGPAGPAARPLAEAGAGQPWPAAAGVAPGAPVTVLLVEDDEGDAVLAREWLHDTGEPVTLRWARSLVEARRLITEVDCVLLDLGLPDAVGLAGLRQLRGYAPRVPVVVLTGQEDERLGVAAVAAGAQDYLVKGQVTGVLLARTIRYAVHRRRAEEIESALLEERLHGQENARLERGLLPRPLVRDPAVSVTTRYLPGGRRLLLGGDFFDVVEAPSGTLHMIIGDVAGHGPDEAALGVALRIAWRTLILAGRPLGEALRVMDRVLVHERNDSATFTTVCALSIEPGRDAATMYLSGHPAPLVEAGTGWSRLPQRSGPALGLIAGASWSPVPVDLPARPWSVLLYTDGAVEGRVEGGEQRLGSDGLVRLLSTGAAVRRHRAGDHGGLLDALTGDITRLHGGPLPDDMALLLVAAAPAGGRG